MPWRFAPVLAAALVLVWHTLQYCFVTDDAYISFVYARNFAEHGALVFNASDLAHPVEGYTNFLWTVLLGTAMFVGVAPQISSLLFGALFAIGSIVFVYRIALVLTANQPVGALASAFLATSAGFACWASGGLETQMFTFFVIAALFCVVSAEDRPSRFRWVGVLLALAAMTRPEGLLCVGIIGGYRLANNLIAERRIVPNRDELLAAAGFLALWGPWFAWRTWYYGYPFPNTYYVKAAGEASAQYAASMRSLGYHYVWTWVVQTKVLFLAPLVFAGALVHPLRSLSFRFGLLLTVFVAIYLAYAVRVGGDFMGLHRFILPATVMVLLLAALGVGRIAALVSARVSRKASTVAIALGAVVLGLFAFTQLRLTARANTELRADRGIDTPAYLDLYARDRAKIGAHMRDCFLPGDFSIFGGVGAKPFMARAEGIDVFGLVSERIAHEVPRTRARAGHNKWGPNALLLEHDPDFVFSCYSLHREANRPGWNCSPSFWTSRGYERITLHIPGLEERGEYYTFLAKKTRQFDCPGMIR